MKVVTAALAVLGMVIAFFAVIAGFAYFGQGLDYSLTKTFSPKYEQVRRNTFEQSQSYNEGMVRDLENIRNQYLHSTNDAEKAALAATFVHRAEAYPNQLPPDLQSFYTSIR
jgi:uncharacterized protein YsxB (DUF464 family)